jgi:N-acetylmuramoyl-L-alanine amidase
VKSLPAVLLSLLCTLTQAADVRDLRLWRAPDHTRLVLDLSAAVEHRLLVLDNPRRVVVDVSDATLRAAYDELPLQGTPISALRTGIRNGTDLRLVLDLSAAVLPKSFSLRATDQASHRLVIDLFDADPALTATAPSVKKRASSEERRDVIVAIDAGHGGEDPGALGPGACARRRWFSRSPGNSSACSRGNRVTSPR